MQKWLARITGVAIVYTYLWIFLNYAQIQRDFPVYWSAAKAWLTGLSPYHLDNLSSVLQQKLTLPYTYTPLSLLIFSPLALLNYSVAFGVFFAIKWLFTILLFAIWLKYWIKENRTAFVFFALAAYNRAIWGDLVAGNVVMIEQVLLWTAFSFLLFGRYSFYSVSVLGASLFKVVPAIWAAPLFFLRSGKGVVYGATIIITAIAVQAGSFWMSGFSVQDWLGSILWDHGGGRGNPCVAAFFKDLNTLYGFSYPRQAYLAVAALISSITTFCWIRCFQAENKESLKRLLLFSCLSLSFVLSEFKGYSYILLIPSTWYVWTMLLKRNPWHLTVAFLIFETAIDLTYAPPFGLLWNYSPMFIAGYMAFHFCRHLWDQKLPNVSKT